MSKTIEIDGARGEGGGQVLRSSLALALITGKPFHLRNIRARRSKPGLQAQHLMCVHAAAEIGRAKVRGGRLQSTDLVFEPGDVAQGEFRFKIGTAGATSLVLHTVYLPLALAGGESTVTIEGGTHVKASPCYDFLAHTWSRYMGFLGIQIELNLARAGFYPRGGGECVARIRPCAEIRAFHGVRTEAVTRATVVAALAGLPEHIAERMADRATERLRELGLDVELQKVAWRGGPGCMLGIELPTAPAPTFFFALGEKGKPAEMVAHEAADQVERYLSVAPLAVDEHSADQLLLPLALARGASDFRVASLSSHLLTNAHVIQSFVERTIDCVGVEGEPGVVQIAE